MEKKTIIWHAPQENLPESGKVIIFLVPDDGICMGKYWEDINKFQDYYMDDFEYNPDDITKWAYIEQLIATSKALDVATKALTNLAEPDGKIMRGYNLIADGAIKDIEEIIGGK